MAQQPKQIKLWNPGLDLPVSDHRNDEVKIDDDKSKNQGEVQKSEVMKVKQKQGQGNPFLLNNPLVNYLHMFSLIHQNQQQNGHQVNNQQKQHPQIPPFLQLLNANQALNAGIRLPSGPQPTINRPSSSSKRVSKITKDLLKKQQQLQNQQHEISTDEAFNKANPIVESVLGQTSGPVNYNSCAICGTSFRLTTDLVSHMRNNHRQSRYKRKIPTNNDGVEENEEEE